jgi:hypothetical protein
MTNLIERSRLDQVLKAVLEHLAESHLAMIIDDPVQSAVATFDYRSLETDPNFQFIDTATHFYHHIHKTLGKFDEKSPAPMVQREWMNLLETRYRTVKGSGFHLAYLDAIEDIEPVLSNMAGIIISHIRERHTRWVYFKWIAGLSWSDKCALVKTLIDRNPFLEKAIQNCPPPLMADGIFELVLAIVSADKTVRSLLIGDTCVF